MSFWNITNPVKPTGIHDPNSLLDYPIDYTNWLSDIADSYLSHTIVNLVGGIINPSSNVVGGIIIVWITGGTVGETASFTVRIVTTGGRIDDRTFYLKIRER